MSQLSRRRGIRMRLPPGCYVVACGLSSVAAVATADSDSGLQSAAEVINSSTATPKSGEEIRLAQAAQGTAAGPSTPEPRQSPTSGAAQQQEIVVAAQRRNERLQDVPLSVTAIDQNSITKLSVTEIQDVSRLTPGVDSTTSFGGQSVVYIRGIVWTVGAATT